MKKQRIIYVAFLFGILYISGSLWCQNFVKDYNKIAAIYNKLPECSVKVKVRLFTHEQDSKPTSVLSSELRFNESGYWARNEHMEMLYNKRCVLIIDHLKKCVQYSKPADLQKVKQDAGTGFLDTSVIKKFTVKFVGNNNGLLEYDLAAKDKGTTFQRVIYKIDAATYC